MRTIRQPFETAFTALGGNAVQLVAKCTPNRTYLRICAVQTSNQTFVSTLPNSMNNSGILINTGTTATPGYIEFTDKTNPFCTCEWYCLGSGAILGQALCRVLEVFDVEVYDPPESQIVLGDESPITRQMQSVSRNAAPLRAAKLKDSFRRWQNAGKTDNGVHDNPGFIRGGAADNSNEREQGRNYS